MENNGIRIDVGYLDSTIQTLERQIRETTELLRQDEVYTVWRQRYGPKSNLNSLEQLANVLFDSMQLPYYEEFTKTGRYKSDETVLAEVNHPFVKSYIGVRKTESTLAKLVGIKRETCNGILRPSLNLAASEDKGGAITYRSSSSSPNAQNWPRRNPVMEKLIRPCFIPHKGELWGEVDFSGVEVKIAACYTRDPKLIEYVTDTSTDMHRDEASGLFLLPIEFLKKHKDWAKKTVRDATKNQWVFPQFYGDVYFQCAPNVWERMVKEKWTLPETTKTVKEHLASKGITKLGLCDVTQEPVKGTFEHHMKEQEKSLWYKRFPVYTQWKKDNWANYQKNGWLRTLTGFVISGHYRRNQINNTGIQGSAFHCLLQTLIWLQEAIDKYHMKTKLILQIHDSGNQSILPKEVEDVLCLWHEFVTKRLPKHWPWIIVPLDVEAEISPEGGSWYEKKLVSPIIPENGEHLQWKKEKWVWN